MSRSKRHLILIGLLAVLGLLGAGWATAAAAETTGSHVLTSVPYPTPDPHP
jgi:hypothetical protein